MPIKTAANMDKDELLKVRRMLGLYFFKAGGWCRLGEQTDGSFYLEVQEAGAFKPKFITCEPEHIIEQEAYYAVRKDQIANIEYQHPELSQHFSKHGEPITDATIIRDFIESPEGQAFVPKGIAWKNPWFEVMQKALADANGGETPKFSKPFSFKDWAEKK